MSDPLYRQEVQDYRDYRGVFISSTLGQRVLADLIDKFCYNRIELPQSSMDLAKLDGSRDVIRYIIDKCGLGEGKNLVSAMILSPGKAPAPIDQTIAITEDED